MADFEFKLPDIGEGVTEGEIVAWHVSSGDAVAEDDPMVEVMTDKATVTIGAPTGGTIKELRADVGATVQVGQVIVVIVTEGAAAEAGATARAGESEESAATAVGDIREGLPGAGFFRRNQASARGGNGGTGSSRPAPPRAAPPAGAGAAAAAPSGRAHAQRQSPAAPDYFEAKPLATPATRKLARDLGVDLRRVRPSGPGGRVINEDVRAHASGGAPASSGAAASRAAAEARAPQADEPEERTPFVGIRRKIAERMQQATRTAAHFTFVEECDASRLKSLRERLRPAVAERGANLSFLPFIVKAVVASLKQYPVLNSTLDETTNELVYRHYYHIGIATATEQGLVVPVVRHADRLSILELARELDRLGTGARDGTLSAGELTGSTFTVTSLGKQGGLFATPVLNFPEVGILGVHQMKQKPVVRDGEIVVGDVMLLSLSFDHRIVDGHVGAGFAYDVIARLENPESLFLDMV